MHRIAIGKIPEAILEIRGDIRYFDAMRLTAFFFCLLLLARIPAAAQEGTYDFLRLDTGARAAALTGSFVSMTDDANVLFYNPAALSTLTVSRVSVGYLKHLLDVNAGHAVYARSVGGFGTVAAGVVYVDYGTTTETDASGNILGSFGARDLAFIAGGAIPINAQASVGLSAKFISSTLADYHSSALAADIGLLYLIPDQNISVGAAVANVGTQLSTFAGTTESMPLDVRIGITKRPEHLPVLLNLNFHKLNQSAGSLADRFSAFTFGAEFLMSESVRFRVGYDNEKRRELKLENTAGLAGFAIGGGILWKDYQVDYAFNSYGKIGGLHRFSLGLALP